MLVRLPIVAPSTLRRAVLAGLFIAGLGAPAGHAAEVVLRLKDGGFEIQGTLAAFDGRTYRIETDAYGTLSLEAARFDCAGADCTQQQGARASTLPAAKGADPGFSMHGSKSIGTELMPALIRAFAASTKADLTQIAGTDPGAIAYDLRSQNGADAGRIELQRRGSATAFQALEKGQASIGMSDRRIGDDEVRQLAAVAPQIRSARHEHVLGLGGVAIVVARESRATALSLDMIAKIFSGQIKDWSELGLAPGRIVTYVPEQRSETFDIFDRLVLKPRRLTLAPGATIVGTAGELPEAVAQDAAGIGIAALALTQPAKPLDLQTTCGLNAAPSTFALRSDEYPLLQRIYLYTTPRLEQPLAREFLQFALSEAAQVFISAGPFVNQTLELASPETQAARMAFAAKQPIALSDAAQMRLLASDTKGARRLSVTFRFAPSSWELDVKSRADVVRLSRSLSGDGFRGRILLLGFTDQVGTVPINTTLSLGRATQVRAALLGAAGGKLDAQRVVARGYGALAPVACSDTAEGLNLNRRVEVWIQG